MAIEQATLIAIGSIINALVFIIGFSAGVAAGAKKA